MPALLLPPGYALLPLRTPTLPPATHTNCYAVGERSAILVDPGSAFPGELRRVARHVAALARSGGVLVEIVVTHHHADHHRGVAPLARAHAVPVAAHRRTLDRLALAAAIPRRALDDGDLLVVDGGSALRVLVTPGHAEGHLCLFDEAQRVLLAGDMVLGAATTVISPPEGDMAAYLASLRRLAALDPALILPAHGPPRDEGRRCIEQLIAHRLMRAARVAAALDRTPRDLLAVTRAAYPDVSPLLWPLASRSALAHLIQLEGEGRARRVPPAAGACVGERGIAGS
jgi:glyoxylase-like metal-dependent hydrolase (beta-lactamase superfamily II)